MTSYSMPMCYTCKHHDKENEEADVCLAFPDGIPNEILLSYFDHTQPYPDADNPQDNGIRFEPIQDTNA